MDVFDLGRIVDRVAKKNKARYQVTYNKYNIINKYSIEYNDTVFKGYKAIKVYNKLIKYLNTKDARLNEII